MRPIACSGPGWLTFRPGSLCPGRCCRLLPFSSSSCSLPSATPNFLSPSPRPPIPLAPSPIVLSLPPSSLRLLPSSSGLPRYTVASHLHSSPIISLPYPCACPGSPLAAAPYFPFQPFYRSPPLLKGSPKLRRTCSLHQFDSADFLRITTAPPDCMHYDGGSNGSTSHCRAAGTGSVSKHSCTLPSYPFCRASPRTVIPSPPSPRVSAGVSFYPSHAADTLLSRLHNIHVPILSSPRSHNQSTATPRGRQPQARAVH